MNAITEPVGYRKVHYRLMRRDGRYQWMREDGVPLSPEFGSAKCALRYSKVMPMLTEEEWNDQDVPIEELSA